MLADLHVHTRYSTRPSQWFLQKIGCPESFTEPLQVYHLARRRGMTLVTITDHNRIDGALEIAHLPQTFVSEEVTTYFPEDGCKVHVLAYRISEAQHADIQRLRENIYDLVAYLKQATILCAIAHPLYAVNDRLTLAHFEKLLLLFRVFELNGDSTPEANRCLETVLRRLTPGDIDRLAEAHRLSPLWPEPWRKVVIGGSDDHSSLTIGHTYTRVAGAASESEFLDGICAGRAEAVETPSSPRNLAHNLYSIAYQFYRHKLNLGPQVPKEFLLRYIDRSLRCTGEEETGLFSRLHFLWRHRHLRKVQGTLPAPLVELVRQETSRLIEEEPDLFVIPETGDRRTRGIDERWFNFIHKMSNRILLGFADHLTGHFTKGNLFSIFHTIGSAAGFCTLLAPYFVAFAHYHRQRRLALSVLARFGGAPSAPETTGIFADSSDEALASAFFALPTAGRPHAVLTCASGDGGGPAPFAPIGVSDFGGAPGERLVYPPLLEMLDHCFRRDIRRVHLVGAGPTALAGLFIARFLKLPLEATHTDAIPRFARNATQDPFIEDLSWKYVIWVYQQTDAVFVPSRRLARMLVEKGLAEEKIRLSPAPSESQPDGPQPLRPPDGLARHADWGGATCERGAA
jgi:hypothetical protein